MSSRNQQLDGLRRQIDSLDDRIHDLLIERSGMIEQIIAAKRDGQAKLRPGREAEIARRLVGRHHGRFPAASVVRIWREIINAFTCMQGPFSVALPAGDADRPIRELARDHFGGTPERVSAVDAVAALGMAIDGTATLAVLPWGDRAGPWLRRMLDAAVPELRICFALPFIRGGSGTGTAAMAVGLVESEPTERERSIIAVDGLASADHGAIEDAARSAGLEPLGCREIDAPDGAVWVLETGGRADAAVANGLGEALGGTGVLLGVIAEPIILPEEPAGT